jgi:hypothetical protein
VAFLAGQNGGIKPVRGRIANAKIFGWLIYAAGFAIWLFGYLSAGHAPLFDWNAATPWWISSFVPNLEAELGLALMFASMIPTLPWARLFPFALFLVLAAVALAFAALHIRAGRPSLTPSGHAALVFAAMHATDPLQTCYGFQPCIAPVRS